MCLDVIEMVLLNAKIKKRRLEINMIFRYILFLYAHLIDNQPLYLL